MNSAITLTKHTLCILLLSKKVIIFSSDSLTIGINNLIYLNYLSSDTETRYWYGYSLIYNCFSHFQIENY